MDINKLERLLKQEEQPKLDYKLELKLNTDGEKKELAKDVIAIANSRGGRGYIIFGVEDKTKKIVGIDKEKYQEESIQQIINNRCNPPIPVEVEILQYKGKDLAVLTIYKSNSKPHQMIQNGAFYIRRGSTTDVAHRDEVARMFQENGIITYEKVLIYKADINDLDYKMINSIYPYTEPNLFLLLENLDVIGEYRDKYHPTVGGMLLFGINPYKYLPHVYIEIIHDQHREIITGNIIEMLDKTESYIANLCKDKKYPLKGLFDVITNAVIHRDYLDFYRGISIEIENNEIYITNPGALVAGNKIYSKNNNMYNPKRRNPWLYQRVLMIDGMNRLSKKGLGLRRINDMFKDYGKVKYINLDSDNLFKVILPSFKNYKPGN